MYKITAVNPIKLFPYENDSMELPQTIYNHFDSKTTKHYEGIADKPTIKKPQQTIKSHQEAFKSIDEIKKMIEYFKKAEMSDCYLIFVLSSNTAMKIGDILSLGWEQLINSQTNEIRECVSTCLEDKQKYGETYCRDIYLNSLCREAIKTYCKIAKINSSENSYGNKVFSITYNQYLSKLKCAAREIGIDYCIGTESARQWLIDIMNIITTEQYVFDSLNKLYNHTDYKGLTNVNRNEFYEKIADYFNG